MVRGSNSRTVCNGHDPVRKPVRAEQLEIELVGLDVGESSFALSDAGRHDPQVVFVDEFGVEQRPIIYFGLALPVVVSSAAD
jgi:hypothetical protein